MIVLVRKEDKSKKIDKIELSEEVYEALMKYNGKSKKKGRAFTEITTPLMEGKRRKRKHYELADLEAMEKANPLMKGQKRVKKREKRVRMEVDNPRERPRSFEDLEKEAAEHLVESLQRPGQVRGDLRGL